MQREGKGFENNLEAEKEKFIAKIQKEIEEVFFEEFPNKEERFGHLISRLNFYFNGGLINKEQLDSMANELKNISEIEERSEFAEKAIKILEPILVMKFTRPKEFESIGREIASSSGVKLSETLYYRPHKEQGYISIHATPARTLERKEIFDSYAEGFTRLVEVLENNPEIKHINATSWIVAEHPRIFERLGFKILKVYEDRDQKVGKAVAEREDFLSSEWIKKLLKK